MHAGRTPITFTSTRGSRIDQGRGIAFGICAYTHTYIYVTNRYLPGRLIFLLGNECFVRFPFSVFAAYVSSPTKKKTIRIRNCYDVRVTVPTERRSRGSDNFGGGFSSKLG